MILLLAILGLFPNILYETFHFIEMNFHRGESKDFNNCFFRKACKLQWFTNYTENTLNE